MDIWQATSLIPACRAWAIRFSKEETFLRRMMKRIMRGPAPNMFIRDSPSLVLPRGIIPPNIRSSKVLFARTRFGRRRIFSPQKVKNIVTRRPMAAAPLAMIKEAMALSRSPLKTTILLSLPGRLPKLGDGSAAFPDRGDEMPVLPPAPEQLVAGPARPGLDVIQETRVGRRDFHHLAGGHGLDLGVELQNRPRALEPAGVELQDPIRFRRRRGCLQGRGRLTIRNGRLFGGLGQILHDRPVSPIAAGKIARPPPVLGQDPGRQVSPEPDLAIGDDLLLPGQFAQAVAELVQRYIERTGDEAEFPFFRIADVQQDRLFPVQAGSLRPIGLGHLPVHDVARHVTGHVHGILGRGIRRGIGEFQTGQVVDGGAEAQGRRQDVDPLVHAVVTHRLSPQKLAVRGEQHLQGQGQGVRIIAGVRVGVDRHAGRREAGPFRRRPVRAHGGHGQVEDLGDVRPQDTPYAAARPLMRSAASRPCRLAGPARGSQTCLPPTRLTVSTASPMA